MSGELPTVETKRSPAEAGVIRAFVSLYSSWKTLLINAVLFVGYYLLFYGLVVRSNSGFFLLTIPISLLVVFVLSSSTLATIAVSYLRISLKRRAVSGVVESPVGIAVGAIVATCSCNLPLLTPAMYFIGLNSLEVSGVISFLAAYQEEIVGAIVAVNVGSIYYYLNQISRFGWGGSSS